MSTRKPYDFYGKLKLFNPTGTWMDRVDSNLLRRLWAKLDYPGVFQENKWGITVYSQYSIYGDWAHTVVDPTLTNERKEA